MINKDLIFYNKEGYPINFTYDEDSDVWNSRIFFDKNHWLPAYEL